jgi:5-methylthioribose kinase
MHEIDATTAAAYLRDVGRIPNDGEVHVSELSGGVSNIVLRVDQPGREPFVLKQCRERLRVPMEWHARLDRIWTEYAALELLRAILTDEYVPRILFEDRQNYLFAMTCAPDLAVTWKTCLMAGDLDPSIAAKLGTILAKIHAEAPGHPALNETLADTSLFDELRVDPYYRTVARAHPDLAPRINALIDSMNLPDDKPTLVLGDFSPKNILVYPTGLILLDFECAHAGDPAFDLGFFLSHLVLKSIRSGLRDSEQGAEYLDLTEHFWNGYLDQQNREVGARSDLVRRGTRHAAACCLARVDGKSPVEYLDSRGQAAARSFARDALLSEPATWDDVLRMVENAIIRGMA